MSRKIVGRFPTIPEYYTLMINSSVDLIEEPKQCCPFHHEDTPSFSYSVSKNVWRCFGGCHTGGDVIELHRMNYHLRSREEAKQSLQRIFEVTESVSLKDDLTERVVDENRINENSVYLQALRLSGDNPDRWLELDYVMSKYPVEASHLTELIDNWLNA